MKNYGHELRVVDVPPFDEYWEGARALDKHQQRFYNSLEEGLRTGDYLDVQGQWAYLMLIAQKVLLWKLDSAFDEIFTLLTSLQEIYFKEEKFVEKVEPWRVESLIAQEKWEEFLEHTEVDDLRDLRFSDLRLNVQEDLGLEAEPTDILGALSLFSWTKLSKENPNQYKSSIRSVLGSTAPNGEPWFEYLSRDTARWHYGERRILHNPVKWKDPQADPVTIHYKFRTWNRETWGDRREGGSHFGDQVITVLEGLEREARNHMRESLNLPRIGEGWVSETELFYLIKNAFPQTSVVQHGKPPWLGRQHFDIWIPRWRVALEYQGKQHYEPVAFFGGEEAFSQTVERDRRKKELAASHQVTLIEVREGYEADQVIQLVLDAKTAHM